LSLITKTRIRGLDAFNQEGEQKEESGCDKGDMHLKDPERGGVGVAIVVAVAPLSLSLPNPSKKKQIRGG
jgi:hypothetical protein